MPGSPWKKNAGGFQSEAATTALLLASAAEEKNMVATCIDASTCIFRTHAYRYIHLHACRQRVRCGHTCIDASTCICAHTHTDAYICTLVDNVCAMATHGLRGKGRLGNEVARMVASSHHPPMCVEDIVMQAFAPSLSVPRTRASIGSLANRRAHVKQHYSVKS